MTVFEILYARKVHILPNDLMRKALRPRNFPKDYLVIANKSQEKEMDYSNPIIKGFYPDPSVCRAGDMFYLVCSSFQYFPGVPLFESKDLLQWKQIGHCLTRPSQIQLEKVTSSGGVFASTIRYQDGCFYMTTTNNSTQQNFLVWTDDIYGEWSEAIVVDQKGIDPSLYFEDGKTFFMSTGADDQGIEGIIMSEIDIQDGRKLTASRCIWQGTGGRYLEGPHIYQIGGRYYLLAAEGGTEYGHMVVYARGESLFGPYETDPANPILTNRDLGGYVIQGVGHGDLIQTEDRKWWLIHLGFRQIGQWLPYHHLGREVFLTPVAFGPDGRLTAGHNGTVLECFSDGPVSDTGVLPEKRVYSFANTSWDIDWCYLRLPHRENYSLEKDRLQLRGTEITLDQADSPTFIGLRQKDFQVVITCDVTVSGGEAGITLYMDESQHYDLAIRSNIDGYEIIERLNIGDVKAITHTAGLSGNRVSLMIRAENEYYRFYYVENGEEILLGKAQTKYLSSEVARGFTGVIIGLYAQDESRSSTADFTGFSCEYQ